MKIARDIQLLRLIKIIPPLLVTAFAIMAILIVINNNQIKLESDLQALRQDFTESRKGMIKAQVEQLVQQINYEKSRTESVLKEDIKQQIYMAHTIATNIYRANADKSEAEVTQLITSALRDIRFNNGRGYFFIYKTTGESVMHPIVPSMEGTQQIELQDIRGSYIVRDMGVLAKEQGETFYNWWFVKPENTQQEFQKIGFGKHFAPYDWFIGTGEYVVDVENDIKRTLMDEIASIRYGENGYAILLDYDGQVLVHYDQEFAGTNFYQHPNNSVVNIGKKIVRTAQQNAGFIEYISSFMPSTGEAEAKTSYVQGIPEWRWALVMGFYQSEIDAQLSVREQEISVQNERQLYELLGLSVVVTLFFIVLSFILTKQLSTRFTLYEARINKDFSELNRVKLESQYQALHDALTELPNRVLLEEHIAQAIALSKANNKLLAVIFVDLDDFKKINDTHGHSVGDEFLKHLGQLFKRVITSGDSVARFGGDEFIFCFPELDDISQAEDNVRDIASIFKQRFEVAGKSIYSNCSMGVAMFPNDGDNVEQLISKADTALYKSKAVKKGSALFFNSQIDEQVKRDFAIETELRTAIARSEISLVYQPQIDVQTGQIVGVEALCRWHNATLGHVPPDEFISVAENSGTIGDLGAFVFYQAMRDIRLLNCTIGSPISLSINISPKQLLEPNFVNEVTAAADELLFDPQMITLEITENVLISDLSVVQPVLTALRDHGFKLSLDDFGTGYSSLSYLSNLPMNEIKIDRSFIDKFLTNSHSESMVKTIIAIGEFCELKVVAEGVENQEQYDRLAAFHCDLIQGYYLSKPLPYDELVAKYYSLSLDIQSIG
ncbi:cache domain-containing protein [Alteromonas sp. ASW11-36]|uniref:Cache domain-containing protein n=1 Tax=Alteromonas arenosi TaxID=3055817 RepID=A0ABT7STA1_9ALTE|nr:cache domain-containing protein [Alteromonas sp. ASW11-36]MDM7859411.1 cache domain-containing protein [Alteromonas sp. ASW11-36]